MEIWENLDINNLDGEIWKTIENFPDYEVSNMGRVKSFKKWRGENERILNPRKNNRGYLQVRLRKNKKPHTKKIHRLVLEAFKPNKDLNKTECNHIDGNKENNYVENLEWCTHSENIKHAVEIGLIKKDKNSINFGKHRSEETIKLIKENHANMKGENNPLSILTEKNVIEIRIDLKKGILTQKEIAKKFGVCQVIISNIKNKKRWKHI